MVANIATLLTREPHLLEVYQVMSVAIEQIP